MFILENYLLQKEMEQLRKINKQLDTDLRTHKETSKKTEVTLIGDLDCIRKELNRSCKHNQDLEVTNSELKEEVTIDVQRHRFRGGGSNMNNIF